MAKQQPFLPLFFGDFMASTAEWKGLEASLYLTLLGYEWSIGDLPTEPARLCTLVRWDRKMFDRCWPQVAVKFVQRGDRLVNERLEIHRARAVEIAGKNSASGKKGAETRWHNDSDRRKSANGADMASAIEPPMAERHAKNDGAQNGNPNHPIPSHLKPKRESASAKRAKPVKTTLPTEFQLDHELRQYAIDRLPDVDPDALMESYRGKAIAKGWEYANWRQAFQDYVRNAMPSSGHFAAGQYPRITKSQAAVVPMFR